MPARKHAAPPPDEDEDQEQQEPPTPDEPGEPKPAVPPPDEAPGAYSPVLPPLGQAISEAREADGELAAEQMARPGSSVLGSVRAHLARLLAALDRLAKPDA